MNSGLMISVKSQRKTEGDEGRGKQKDRDSQLLMSDVTREILVAEVQSRTRHCQDITEL